MHIVYEPIWGSQERWNLNLVKPTLVCEPHEEAEALANGWLINNGTWYLSRSVRIKTSKLLDRIKNYTLDLVTNPSSDQVNAIGLLWFSYLQRKHLPSLYSPFTDKDRSSWLVLRDQEGAYVSFTKMVQYGGHGIESCLNAYREESGSIGKRMLELEISWAYENGYDYLYIGSGHERGSAYKADIPGFEYWTGTNWSNSVVEYKSLCVRDSEINDLTQLSELWNPKSPLL